MTDIFQNYHLVLAAALVPVLWAAVTDVTTLKIPNGCSLLLLALFAIYAVSQLSLTQFSLALLVGAGIFAVTYALFAWGHLGGGDVKLISVLAVWAGPTFIGDFLMITSLAGGLLAVFMLSRLKIPFAILLDRLGRSDVSENVLTDKLPYGLPIAIGGTVVLFQLAVSGV